MSPLGMPTTESLGENQTCFKGQWVPAKWFMNPFQVRLRWAWHVLRGRAAAVEWK